MTLSSLRNSFFLCYIFKIFWYFIKPRLCIGLCYETKLYKKLWSSELFSRRCS